jgi:hypothetical protein
MEGRAAEPAAPPCYNVGAASADVMPDPSIGFKGQTEVDKGMLYSPLHIRTVVITDGRTPVAIMSGECLQWDRRVIERAREGLKEKYGLEPAQILMNATHTHNGPRVTDEYRELLVSKVMETVGQAMEEARPARLYFGRTECHVGVCRRRLRSDGFVRWGINPYGVVDPEVVVVKAVCAKSGKPIAVLMNYACHPTTVRNCGMGGDFVNFAMRDVESETGAVCLFLQGCAGDVKVANENPDKAFAFCFEGGPERCAHFGEMLSGPVLEAIEEPMEEITGPVAVRMDRAELPLLERQITLQGEAPLEGPERRWARMAKAMLAAMDEEGNYKRTRSTEVYAIDLGDKYRHVALNGEMCVGIGLRIKAMLEGKNVLVSSYTGPSTGYFPAAEQQVELGYEVKAPYSPEAEDFLMKKVMELANYQMVIDPKQAYRYSQDAQQQRGQRGRAGARGQRPGR